MFYGLLLESSELRLLGNERVDGKAATREDDESWLLGLEAWVPCFALMRSDPECANQAGSARVGHSESLSLSHNFE